jgi:fermentation-respiration switch protein FrsA (DUF1100 family)
VRRGLRLLAALIVMLFLFRWFERTQVYHPTRVLDATGAALRRPFEEVRVVASDGVGLHGWHFPADPASARHGLCFLVCHGNGGNISHRLGLVSALMRTGAGVLVFDYRGYGQSEGRPTEEGTYLDAQAFHRWLLGKGYRAEGILAYGESLGGAVATELAVREEVGGVVLQSTFTSVPDLGVELFPWLPVRWLGTIQYDTASKLSRVRVPVLVMHSREDDLVSFRHAERNHEVANEPKRLVALRGGHNDAVYEQEAFREGLESWLNER